MSAASVLGLLFLFGSDLPSAIATGDEAFFRIDYPSAIARYEAALADHQGEADLLWRLARAYVCMGEVAREGEREKLFGLAERYARACIASDPQKAEGHTWLAGTLGYLALNESIGRQIPLSQELYKEAVRAIELNPADDAAYSILGSFYRALGNVGWLQRSLASLFLGPVPGGGHAEAEAALKKAIAIDPAVMRHHYELGVLYLDMGREEEATRSLDLAVQLPVRTAIDRPRLEKIRALLSSLKATH